MNSSIHLQQIEISPSQNSEISEPIGTISNNTKNESWKQKMRKQKIKKKDKVPILRLKDSSKSKNIAKNLGKVVIYVILHTNTYDNQIEGKKEFYAFIKKNKNLQNLPQLIKLAKPNEKKKLDLHHQLFRKICFHFLRTNFVQYAFNSKIKDPQWHLRYRNTLIDIFKTL